MMATIRFCTRCSRSSSRCSFAVRFYWGFVGNSFASWRAIIPHNRDQFYWGREMAKYYTFLRRDPVPVTGPQLPRGAAYTVVSIGMFAQVLSGLLLIGWIMAITARSTSFFGWGTPACPAGSRASGRSTSS